MQGVSGSADDFVRGSVGFGDSNPIIDEKKKMAKDAIEVANGVPHEKDMCQCGEVEDGDADAHTYLPEPTE
eukprot:11587945-Karenia_brevis.AAC.1